MSEIAYRKCGDYFLPEIALSEQATKPLGKYGRLRRTDEKNYLINMPTKITPNSILIYGDKSVFTHRRKLYFE